MINDKEYQVYWILLSAPLEVLKKRIKSRDNIDIWETDKSLYYFYKRFLELAAYYGFPVVINHDKTINDTIDEIINQVPRYYNECQSLALCNLRYKDIYDHDIENSQEVNDYPDCFNDIKDFYDDFFKDDIQDENLKKKIQNRYLASDIILTKDYILCSNIEVKLKEISDDSLRLCLIKRLEDNINMEDWKAEKKSLIAAEHIYHIDEFLKNVGIDEDVYSLDRIIGSSESFLVNQTNVKYDLCDAIVESGETLKANNLEIFAEVLPRGSVKIGLYMNK